jgi:hypothetical protein
MTKLTYKEQITKTVVDQLSDDIITFDYAMKHWWQNPRRDGALRLTQAGDISFRLAKIEYYDHPFKTKETSFYQFVIDLSKKIKCPYYIDVQPSDKGHKPYLRLYDDRISMMLNLYGDLDSYLKSVRTTRAK